MPKFFLKSKKLKKQKTRSNQSESPPVSSVATQSEPLPLSFHLDGLLNSESSNPQASKGSYESPGRAEGLGGHEEVDGAVCHANVSEEVRGRSRLSGRPPPSPTSPSPLALCPARPHPSGRLQYFSSQHRPCTRGSKSWGEEEEEEEAEGRGLGCGRYWLGNGRDWSPSESSQSWKEPAYHLPPPLIPSPPLTLTPSPPPSQSCPHPHTATPSQVVNRTSFPQQPLTTPTQLLMTTPTHQQQPTPAASTSPASLSPSHVWSANKAEGSRSTSTHALTPPTNIVKKNSIAPTSTGKQATPSARQATPLQYPAGGVSDSATMAWNSTPVELGMVLAQRKAGRGEGIQSPVIDRGGDREWGRLSDNTGASTRGGHDMYQQETSDTCDWWAGGRGEEREEGREKEEIHQCRVALEALQERESRLIAEVAELRVGLRTSESREGGGEGGGGAGRTRVSKGERVRTPQTLSSTYSPHPEIVVADLQETLRQTEEAVQAVQGERDELREGVGRIQDELLSLRKSNSLLARRKQQWMEVASQTRVVLEENHSLLSQYNAQQHIISELQTQHHSKVSTLEGELSQMETDKKAAEFELKQMMEGWAHFASQVSRLVGVVEGGANSPQQCGSLQHMAGLLERYVDMKRAETAAQRDRMACLEAENKSLALRVADAKAVIRRLEGEMGEVKNVIREGEEAVARLRGQLEEVQEREEASQLQLAHAITQVDKAMAERDAYARIAQRWQSVHSGSHRDREENHPHDSSRALDEAHHQLQQQAQEHRAQRKRYKTEIHRLRALLASDREKKRPKSSRKERHCEPQEHTSRGH